jgi:hypothetical protein
MKKNTVCLVAIGATLAIVALGACAKTPGEAKGNSLKSAESSITTNENGSVSRTFVESTVTTNGNMVTEHRRETRTNMDMEGNVLETTTSEYAQSYPIGDVPVRSLSESNIGEKQSPVRNTDSFMGIKFGEVFNAANFVEDAGEPEFLRAEFKPAKPLDGFDDYFVYVTPKTKKVAKVYACAKDVIDPGSRWRRHYLIEALEKRYDTWARLCSYRRPCYTFNIGGGRHVTACLDGASENYRTVVVAWDDSFVALAAEEREQLREEARKSAAQKRNRKVKNRNFSTRRLSYLYYLLAY